MHDYITTLYLILLCENKDSLQKFCNSRWSSAFVKKFANKDGRFFYMYHQHRRSPFKEHMKRYDARRFTKPKFKV